MIWIKKKIIKELSKSYQRAIVDYVSGMIDSFAIRSFNEITFLEILFKPLKGYFLGSFV